MPERLLTVENAGDYVAVQTVEAMQLPGCADPPTRPATVVWQRTQTSSGRWQARYQGPDGLTRSAPRTFDNKRSAEQWLTLMEGWILTSGVPSAEQSKVMFGGYSTQWVADRRLGPRSRDCTQCCCGCTSCPGFGERALNRIRPPIVRL
jgi:hypothetical protein